MDFEYEIKNNKVTITKYTGTSKDVVMPNKMENLPVTTIGKYAFADNKLTSIVLPKTLTTIGEFAFWTNKLTSIVLPKTLTTICAGSFLDNELTSIVLPNKFRTDEQVQSIFNFSLEELDNKNRKIVAPHISKLLSEYVTYHFHDIIVEHTTPSMALVKEVLKTTNTSTNKSVIRGTIA